MLVGWRIQVNLVLSLLCFVILLMGCRHADLDTSALLFPGLADRQEMLNAVVLRGPGNTPLVSLEKQAGVWYVHERRWPADMGKLNQYLFTLSQARLTEAKTDNPKLYAKLGVEPIANKAAQGVELTLEGGGAPLRVLIGHAHDNFSGSYVRRNNERQSWLTDRSLALDHDPAAWLNRSLIDLPLARIAQVHVDPMPGRAFTLTHRQDHFAPDDAPVNAAADVYQGDALAGALDQLKFEEVAFDQFEDKPERMLRFFTVDGAIINVSAWRLSGRVWVRLSASMDEARLKQWLMLSNGNAARQFSLRKQVENWNARFVGYRFLLPNFQAATFMLTREQILKGAQ